MLVCFLSVQQKGSHFIDTGIECTLKKFGDDTKLRGAVDSLEGKGVTQRDISGLEWIHVNLMKFSKTQCMVCTWIRAIPCISTDSRVNGLREALQRRTWGSWWIRSQYESGVLNSSYTVLGPGSYVYTYKFPFTTFHIHFRHLIFLYALKRY